ncbi:hypothetical protein [Mariniphaga sp.]|uniref:hypothetical protein n=1 Tax=Mariniphaga sp. TaxID=1954475 RepID=UPI003562EBB0
MAEPLHASSKLKNCFQERMFFRKAPALFLLLLFLMFFSSNPLQAQITSTSNGNWSSPGTWGTGSVPTATDNVVINDIVTIQAGTTAEVNDLTINATGKLIVYGTLIVNNDMTMNFQGNNESEFVMGVNSLVLVKGNVHLTNKVSLNLSSYFIVMGNLTKDGATQQGDIVINDASIYIFGTINENTGLVACDNYDGLTQTNTDDCHSGTETSLEENVDGGIIPPYIVELIYECNPPQITNPGDINSCGSLTLPAISGSNLSGNAAYFTGPGGTGSLLNPGDEITISITLYIYDDAGGGCVDEENFTVTIYPFPATGEIIPD